MLAGVGEKIIRGFKAPRFQLIRTEQLNNRFPH